MVIARVSNWPMELSLFLRERRHTPFAWGTNDCLMFAADLVLRLTGQDLAAAWRGTYDTEEQANALLAEHGGVQGFLTQAFGFNGHRQLGTAQRGDIMLIKYEGTYMAGVVDDSGQWLAVPLNSAGKLVRLHIRHAWRCWSY